MWPDPLRPQGVLVQCIAVTAAGLDCGMQLDPGEKPRMPHGWHYGAHLDTTTVGDTRTFPVVLLSVNGVSQFKHVAFCYTKTGLVATRRSRVVDSPTILPWYVLSTMILFSHLLRSIFCTHLVWSRCCSMARHLLKVVRQSRNTSSLW